MTKLNVLSSVPDVACAFAKWLSICDISETRSADLAAATECIALLAPPSLGQRYPDIHYIVPIHYANVRRSIHKNDRKKCIEEWFLMSYMQIEDIQGVFLMYVGRMVKQIN